MGPYDNVPDDSRLAADAEAYFVTVVADSMTIFACPGLTLLDVEHTHTRKAC
jgi:hypothetical protein